MKHNAWTSREIKVLREHYPTATKEEIAELLPRHPIRSIRMTACNHGIRKNAGFRVGKISRYAVAARHHKPVFNFSV